MREEFSREIRSTVTSEGTIEISIVKTDKPKPSEDEVLIKVEACPINPSDLGLLISFAADLDTVSVSGSGNATVAKMKIHEGLMKQMKPKSISIFVNRHFCPDRPPHITLFLMKLIKTKIKLCLEKKEPQKESSIQMQDMALLYYQNL